MDPVNGQTSPLRRKKIKVVTGEVCYVFVTQLAAAQLSAGGVLMEESAA